MPGRKHKRPALFLMIFPGLLILALITLYPFGYLLVMSFTKVNRLMGTPNTFAGFSNWGAMGSDSTLLNSWRVTVEYVGVALLIEIVIGTAIAILLYMIPFKKFKSVMVPVLMFPMFVAPVIVGLMWNFLYSGTYGLYAHLLMNIGFAKANNILGNTSTAIFGIIAMDVWEWTPLIIIIVYATLLSMPRELIEAAEVDGANYFQIVLHIFTPYLRRGLVIGLLIRGMDLIRGSITKILVTTRGGPANTTKTLAMKIYENAFRFFNFGYASVLALALLVFTIILANIFLRTLNARGESL
jgi:multiple sugar transport system permease protein